MYFDMYELFLEIKYKYSIVEWLGPQAQFKITTVTLLQYDFP